MGCHQDSIRLTLLKSLLVPASVLMTAGLMDSGIRRMWQGMPWYYDVWYIASMVLALAAVFYAAGKTYLLSEAEEG